MTIESGKGTPAINPEIKPSLNWVVYQVPTEEVIQPNDLPTAVNLFEIECKGKTISIILPDLSNPLYKEEDFIKDNHATKSLRQIFKYNNDQIGIARIYEEDLQNRREAIEIIKQKYPDVSPKILKSMQRSLLARAYHTEKRIKQIQNNNPIQIIKKVAFNNVFTNESDNMLRERKSKDVAAVFDKKIEKIFKKFLRKTEDLVKTNLGGIQVLKQDYEYHIAKNIEDYLKTEKISIPISFVSLVNSAIVLEQQLIRQPRIKRALWQSEIDEINSEPFKTLEELIKEYIDNQIKVSSFFQ